MNPCKIKIISTYSVALNFMAGEFFYPKLLGLSNSVNKRCGAQITAWMSGGRKETGLIITGSDVNKVLAVAHRALRLAVKSHVRVVGAK